ncbi:hypothetical protein Asi02nite_70420 [Asanoa siamensis]|uniref:ABC transporter domain-containing protein n=1 Tax=Asanoa siamensis TaxID=926357 RepID=A0ABQ4D1V8_9ACTN|nr:hypothetical protein Asi02nite_70420 [Asanoa siamensis]
MIAEATAVRERISLTGQYASVDETLTGRENLTLLGRLHALSRAATAARAADLLDRFDLAGAADRLVRTYSGGQRRRLDLAAGLVVPPDLLFLDEPTTGLDPRSRGEVWSLVRALVDEGATVLLTTQYLDEADQLADRIAVIDHGRLVAEGTNSQLKATVGGGTLRVRLHDPADRAEALAVLARALGSAEPAGDPDHRHHRRRAQRRHRDRGVRPVPDPLDPPGRRARGRAHRRPCAIRGGLRGGGRAGAGPTPGAVLALTQAVLYPLSFFSNIFTTPARLPGWLRAFVGVNPVSQLVSVVRALMAGEAPGASLGWSLLGCAALTAIFAPLAMRRFRSAG